MKFNLNSNHIRLYKLLQHYSLGDINFMCEILQVSDKTIILYIKQLYQIIPNKTFLTKNTKDMIFEIQSSTLLLQIIKNNQIFTKEERILYITLKLLTKKVIILTELAKSFQISRRTLNDDLNIIKNNLNHFSLSILSTHGKGISLIGESLNIKKSLFINLYKYLMEQDELPILFTKQYGKVIKKLNLTHLEKECKKFLSENELDLYFHNNSLFLSFVLSFIENKKQNIPFLEKFLEEEHSHFLNILNICNGKLSEEIPNLDNDISFIENTLSNEFKIKIKVDLLLRNFISRIVFFKDQKYCSNIFELFFIHFNLGNKTKEKCINLFLILRKKYPHIYFSDVIYLYLWVSTQEDHNNIETAVLIYKNFPKFYLPLMKDKIYHNYKIKVLDFITPNELNNFLEKKTVDNIITFEKIDIKCGTEIRFLPLLD